MNETPPKPDTAGPGADPSMEEILASIRRILSEDEPAAAPAQPEASPAAPASNVFMLDSSMLVHPDPHPKEPAMSDMLPTAQEPSPPPPLAPSGAQTPQQRAPQPSHAAIDTGSALVGPDAAAAAAASVSSLVRTLQDRTTRVYQGGPTLEDLVRETLRPLLKDWLDAHLPALVDRQVRAEIERVVGGAIT